ncbi:MAG: C40 family peptidase [Rhodocyclaceae bacterium]|nr:C40 family peptidase [Rhodocyclaceae bacterium]MCA3097493.1 C40 family peptidase [Rhodocyclaceae bacterium]MCA3120479.1 C40 family peptidase [Rhodocyclaceae bacterium]
MITRADVVAEARRWIGTPYQHQARVLGVGVDCAGVVTEVARALGIATLDYDGYGRIPHEGLLRTICEERFDRIDDPEPGCIVVMAFLPGVAQEQHLGILTDTDTMIHAYERIGRCVEHRYSSTWRVRTRALYRYRGVV